MSSGEDHCSRKVQNCDPGGLGFREGFCSLLGGTKGDYTRRLYAITLNRGCCTVLASRGALFWGFHVTSRESRLTMIAS